MTENITIIPYEPKYRDDMLYCSIEALFAHVKSNKHNGIYNFRAA
jgi:hypothetical protein